MSASLSGLKIVGEAGLLVCREAKKIALRFKSQGDD
jgi:hypothetical protein